MDEIEKEAFKIGWLPEDQFKGNPKNWTSAEEYIRRGESLMPFLKSEVKKLREEQKNTIADMKLALKIQKDELEQVKKEGYAQAEADYKAKKEQLDAKEQSAFENQDEEAFKEVKKEREELKPPVEQVEKQQDPPEFVEWNKKNTWYGTDKEMTAEANLQGAVVQNLNPDNPVPLEEMYNEVEKRMRKLYPDKFENKNREDPGEVESGDPPPEKKNGGTFDDLPGAAKAAYERQRIVQEEKGRDFTKDQYLEYYTEE